MKGESDAQRPQLCSA